MTETVDYKNTHKLYTFRFRKNGKIKDSVLAHLDEVAELVYSVGASGDDYSTSVYFLDGNCIVVNYNISSVFDFPADIRFKIKGQDAKEIGETLDKIVKREKNE